MHRPSEFDGEGRSEATKGSLSSCLGITTTGVRERNEIGNIRRSESSPHSPEQAIAARLVIGVTGHRDLVVTPALTQAIGSAIERAKQMVPHLRSTPLVLSVLSPLAEGADRLVAREVLAIPGSILEVVLPLEKDDYMNDFETDESKAQFEQLLSKAKSIRALSPMRLRPEAYEQVGRYVVDQCDVLVALWDGKPAVGKGGTAEIVNYARRSECPLVCVNTDRPEEITVVWEENFKRRVFEDLDEYNSAPVDADTYEKQLREMHESFQSEADHAKLPSETLGPVAEYLLRNYVWADLAAMRYQHLYHRVASLIHPLVLAAVIVVTLHILFWTDRTWILGVEIFLMMIAMGVYALSHLGRWHAKWIDYRFLAERFRSALFIAVANIEVAPLRPPRHLSLAYSSRDWMVHAFFSVWDQRPRLEGLDPPVFAELRAFLCEAWIEDQIRFHEKSSKRHHRRYFRSVVASYVLFGLTIVAASLHIANVGSDLFGNILYFAAIFCPAASGSITAFRMHRDYQRNSMRSTEMVRHLKELKAQMMETKDRDDFVGLLKEIEETMLRENEDWRVVVRFHTPELPA